MLLPPRAVKQKPQRLDHLLSGRLKGPFYLMSHHGTTGFSIQTGSVLHWISTWSWNRIPVSYNSCLTCFDARNTSKPGCCLKKWPNIVFFQMALFTLETYVIRLGWTWMSMWSASGRVMRLYVHAVQRPRRSQYGRYFVLTPVSLIHYELILFVLPGVGGGGGGGGVLGSNPRGEARDLEDEASLGGGYYSRYFLKAIRFWKTSLNASAIQLKGAIIWGHTLPQKLSCS